MSATKIKTRQKDGATEILTLINHPMETGQRIDKKTKAKIPAHYIQVLTVQLNGKTIADVSMGPAISKDPLVSVSVKGAKAGDKVKVSWTDNNAGKGEGEATVG